MAGKFWSVVVRLLGYGFLAFLAYILWYTSEGNSLIGIALHLLIVLVVGATAWVIFKMGEEYECAHHAEIEEKGWLTAMPLEERRQWYKEQLVQRAARRARERFRNETTTD